MAESSSNAQDLSSEIARVTHDSGSSTDERSFLHSDESPEDEDIEIVNYQDYISLNVNRYDFSQVIFLDMKDVYRPAENLQCSYKVTNALFPHPKDRVCLFRLGWISPQDYKTYMWALAPEDYKPGSVFDCSITFSAAFVPQENSENYYQFCYINHQDQIRGASTPFQFKDAGGEDESKNISLSGQLIDELNERIEVLAREKELLMRERNEKEASMRECKRKIEILERQLEDHEDLVALESQHSLEIESLNKKVTELAKNVEEKQKEKDEQTNHYELILERTRASELEHDEMYQTLVKQACKLQAEKTELANEKTVIISEKEALQELYNSLESENAKVAQKLKDLNEEHAEICKLIESRDNELEVLRQKLSQAESTSVDLMKELDSQRHQIRTLKLEYEECLAQRQQIPDQLAGPVYALKTALDHTQSKLDAANERQEKYKGDIEYMKKQLNSKKDELENEKSFSSDLLVRLDMAKLSYKMKYVEAGRYRRELKNVLRQDKALYKKVVEDVEMQIKLIESEWKVPSNTENITRENSARTLSLCTESAMDELLNERMITAVDDANNDTESVYLDANPNATQQDLTLNVEESTCVTPKCAPPQTDESIDAQTSSGICSNKSEATNVSSLWIESQDKLQKELSNITVWKVFDMCLVTCGDELDRLACVTDIDKTRREVTIRVAYQYPLNATQLETRLEVDQAGFDKIRPYRGEKVPRDVWLKVCEFVFAGPTAAESMEFDSFSSQMAPQATSTLSKDCSVKEEQPVSNPNPSASIGGVGWGSLNPVNLAQPLKSVISATAGTAADFMGMTSASSVKSPEGPTPQKGSDKGGETLLSLARYTNSLEDSLSLNGNGDEENKCLLCDKIFPRDVNPEVFNSHMEEHYGPSCPFCSRRFPKTAAGQNELTQHVNEHLREMGDM